MLEIILSVLCYSGEETILHNLVECPFAKQYWSNAAICRVASGMQSFADCFGVALLSSSVANGSIIAIIVWQLWQNRNNVV